MPSTLETDGRLLGIRISGKAYTSEMRDTTSSVTLSASRSAVTEMAFAFADSQDSEVFRSGILTQGATINYGDWRLTVEDIDYGPGAIGPTLNVKAPSAFVTALKGQRGGYSWGARDVSGFVRDIAYSVGMTAVVQPGLGVQTILRAAPDGDNLGDSTWDVLAELSKTTGTWLFEYGSVLVFARPSWLVGGSWGNRQWDLVYDGWGSYSDGLAGMPTYGNRPSSTSRESLSFGLVSTDADSARPGDEVNLSGRAAGAAAGKWIIETVDFPLHVAAPVAITCARPVDPKIEPPREERSSDATGASGPSRSSSGASPAGSAASSAVDRWVSSVEGRSIDADGGFGAQCVDLAISYNKNCVGGPNISGNGKDWYGNGGRSGAYVQIPSGQGARKGDIACWGASWGGGYGHVAIVLADNGGTLSTLSQNPGPARRMNLGKNGLMGYLRPKKWA